MTFAFSSTSKTSSNHLFHPQTLARVEDPITPQQNGFVFFEGTYWQARFHDPSCQTTVDRDKKVEVIDRELLTLLVMPIPAGSSAHSLQTTTTTPSTQASSIRQWVQQLFF